MSDELKLIRRVVTGNDARGRSGVLLGGRRPAIGRIVTLDENGRSTTLADEQSPDVRTDPAGCAHPYVRKTRTLDFADWRAALPAAGAPRLVATAVSGLFFGAVHLPESDVTLVGVGAGSVWNRYYPCDACPMPCRERPTSTGSAARSW